MEKWKKVTRNSSYEISSIGRMRRPSKSGRILKCCSNTNGYRAIDLEGGGRQYVHRLVLEAFRGGCPVGKECNHIDGDKANNRIENLEWVTHSENILHAFKRQPWKCT